MQRPITQSLLLESLLLQSLIVQSLILQSLTLHLANSAMMQHETIQRETQALRRRVAGSAVKRMTARGSALETISQDPRASGDTFASFMLACRPPANGATRSVDTQLLREKTTRREQS